MTEVVGIDDKQAKKELEEIVTRFNASFYLWEKKHKFGANFNFVYDEEGSKELAIRDINLLPLDMPKGADDERVRNSESILRDFTERTEISGVKECDARPVESPGT